MDNIKNPFKSRLIYLVPAFFFVWVFFASYTPLSDFDVWWHLPTGRWIVQNASLPGTEDPFSFTRQAANENLGARSQWLGQVLFYLSERASGLTGVAIFRSLLLVLPFVIVYLVLLQRGGGAISSLSYAAFPAMVAASTFNYTFERPQAFSYLMGLVVLILLEALRRKGGWFLRVALPLSMALWANLHGAYVLGVLLIAAYVAGEALMALYARLRHDSSEPVAGMGFYLVCTSSVLATFFNPNGYRYLLGIFRSFISGVLGGVAGTGGGRILEFEPLWSIWTEFQQGWVLYVLVFAAFVLISLLAGFVSSRKPDMPRLLAFVLYAAFGVVYLRGVVPALIVLPALIDGRWLRSISGRAAASAVLALCILFATSIYGAPMRHPAMKPSSYISPGLPSKAVEFLINNDIEGPMFNFPPWGGYIIWRAYPRYRVFSDSRMMDSDIRELSSRVISTGPGWQGVLGEYGVNFVIMPIIYSETGDMVPLSKALLIEPGWRLLYVSDNSVIFAKTPGPNDVILSGREPGQEDFYNEMLDVSDSMIRTWPANPSPRLARVTALHNLKRYKDARSEAEAARLLAEKAGGQRGAFVIMLLGVMGY